MPLYEYACEACGKRFERIQKFTDPPPDACPHCGKGPVNKLPSSPAIQFKGSGWYVTDYAKKSSADAGKADAGRTDAGKADAGKADADGKSSGQSSSQSSGRPDKSSTSTETAANAGPASAKASDRSNGKD